MNETASETTFRSVISDSVTGQTDETLIEITRQRNNSDSVTTQADETPIENCKRLQVSDSVTGTNGYCEWQSARKRRPCSHHLSRCKTCWDAVQTQYHGWHVDRPGWRTREFRCDCGMLVYFRPRSNRQYHLCFLLNLTNAGFPIQLRIVVFVLR